MDAIKVFRLLVVAEIVLSLASMLAVIMLDVELPPEVDRWLSGDGKAPLQRWVEGVSLPLQIAAIAVLVAYALAYVGSLIGLLLLKRWARTLYIAAFVAGVLLYPLTGAVLATPLLNTVDYLVTAGSGAIVALLFIGPVQERFAHA